MIAISAGDVVAASLAAAGACLALSVPLDFLRRFPLWAFRTYGRGALLLPVLGLMVLTVLVRLATDGQINSDAGLAMVAAAAFLGLVFVSALLRFYLSDYRKQ